MRPGRNGTFLDWGTMRTRSNITEPFVHNAVLLVAGLCKRLHSRLAENLFMPEVCFGLSDLLCTRVQLAWKGCCGAVQICLGGQTRRSVTRLLSPTFGGL